MHTEMVLQSQAESLRSQFVKLGLIYKLEKFLQCPEVTPTRFRLESVCVCIDGRLKDVLFSGVGELVLSPAVVGLLDARISPQRLYRADVRLVKRGDLLHLHLAYQLGVILFSKKTSHSTSALIFFKHSQGTKNRIFYPRFKWDRLENFETMCA